MLIKEIKEEFHLLKLIPGQSPTSNTARNRIELFSSPALLTKYVFACYPQVRKQATSVYRLAIKFSSTLG